MSMQERANVMALEKRVAALEATVARLEALIGPSPQRVTVMEDVSPQALDTSLARALKVAKRA